MYQHRKQFQKMSYDFVFLLHIPKTPARFEKNNSYLYYYCDSVTSENKL